MHLCGLGVSKGREEVVGKKIRDVVRGVGRGQTLTSFAGLINNVILEEGNVLRGCKPDSNMIIFAV